MAEINFGILDTQAPGRIAAIPQQLQEQQAQNAMRLMQFKNTVQQNALAQAKIDEYKRDLAEKDVLRKLMTRPGFDIYDPKHQAEAMGAAPTLAAPIIKHAVDVKQAQARTAKDIAQTEGATTETAVKRQNFINQAKRDLAANPSDDNIRSWAQDAVIQKVFSSDQASQMLTNLLKVPLADRQAMFASAGAPAKQPSSMERLIALRNSLPEGSADRLAIEAQINKEIAGNRTFDPNTGLLVDKVTGRPVTPGATPAGQPGAAPLVPGIAPAGQPVVTPTARPPLDMMQSPAFQDLVRRGVVSTPQEAAALAQAMSLDAAGKPVNITVPNALAGAPVNAMAGAPTGPAPSGLTPVLQKKLGEQKLEAEYAPAIEYGKQFAQTQVKRDMDLADIAGQAVQSAESANRIIGLAQRSDILTGPAANIKLNIARALNLAGADNSQLISNTEKLIAATGQSTLDAIKGAGLGTGQGFTDKDLKFLQSVAGGTIGLTRDTIIELAQLQHKAAVKSAEKWNKRVKEIPENSRAAANLSTEPITIPPLLQSRPAGANAPRPAGAGADWTLMNDAKGNRAWVSPDKTKFIEVK